MTYLTEIVVWLGVAYIITWIGMTVFEAHEDKKETEDEVQ